MSNISKTIILLLLITATATAQEKGKWELIESKDAMTDEVTRYVVLPEKTIGLSVPIIVTKIRTHAITLILPLSLSAKSITVQWRIDELPMVEELWTVSERRVSTFNNQTLLKAMVTGKTLRIRFKASTTTTTVLEFEVGGLSYYLPKLGIILDSDSSK